MKAGDVVYVWRRWGIISYRHFGIYCGRNRVAHHPGWPDGDKSGTICRVSLADFCGGAQPEVVSYKASDCFAPDKVVRRAESRLGESSYCLWTSNCEHFVNWCKTGRSESVQVEECLKAGTVVLVVMATIGLWP